VPTRANYTLKIVFHHGKDRIIPDVIEYVGGWRYLFVATADQDRDTLRIPRRKIRQIYRQHGGPDADWFPVVLRKPRFQAQASGDLDARRQQITDRFRPRPKAPA